MQTYFCDDNVSMEGYGVGDDGEEVIRETLMEGNDNFNSIINVVDIEGEYDGFEEVPLGDLDHDDFFDIKPKRR